MLEKRKAADTLSDLRGEGGFIHCVFLCCDLPYQHIDEYIQKVGDKFSPIKNEVCLSVLYDICFCVCADSPQQRSQ